METMYLAITFFIEKLTFMEKLYKPCNTCIEIGHHTKQNNNNMKINKMKPYFSESLKCQFNLKFHFLFKVYKTITRFDIF